MALIRTSSVVAAISGSIGGVNFVSGKSAPIARRRAYHKPTPSEAITTQQAYFVNATRAWRALTNRQRAAWRAVARDLPRTNRLGQTSALSGYAYFLKVAISALRLWGWQIQDPPELIPSPTLTTFTSDFSLASHYNVSFVISTPVQVVRLQVFGARHFSKVHPKFTGLWREISIIPSAGGASSTTDIRDEWEAIFGLMLEGEAYSLKTIIANAGIDLLPQPPTFIAGFVQAP